MRRSHTLHSNRSAAWPSWKALMDSPVRKAADAYRATPARLTPFKQAEHGVVQRHVEVVGDLDSPLQQPEMLFPGGSGERTHSRHRLACLGDDDLGTGRDLIDKAREMRLRLVDVDRVCHCLSLG